MPLALIGLGLAGPEDVTLRGLKLIKRSHLVFLDSYTSIFPQYKREDLEQEWGVKIVEADREMIELRSDEILLPAKEEQVSLLVIGDPFGATTHTDMYLRATEMGVQVEVVHNASILNAAGISGMQLYRFGQTVSIPFFQQQWKPLSWLDKIRQNRSQDFHTLCLLDIQVKEQSIENLIRQRPVYEPPRFMSVNQALGQILEVEPPDSDLLDSYIVGIARAGSLDQTIKAGKLKQLIDVPFGPPPHSLIVCSPSLHEMELKFIELFSKDIPQ